MDCSSYIGMGWEEARELDWDGYYPILRVRCGEVIVDDVIDANADTSHLVPVYVRHGRMHDSDMDNVGWHVGWHDGFRVGGGQ